MKAVSKARARKGNLAWANKVQTGQQEHKPGTGGISLGRSAQPQRNRMESAKVARSKALRPEKPVY